MGVGTGLTVTVEVEVQPPIGKVYIIVVVPAVIPVSKPEDEPIVAAPVVLAHVPPIAGSPRVVVEPIHILSGPTIARGETLTVTTIVEIQVVGSA